MRVFLEQILQEMGCCRMVRVDVSLAWVSSRSLNTIVVQEGLPGGRPQLFGTANQVALELLLGGLVPRSTTGNNHMLEQTE